MLEGTIPIPTRPHIITEPTEARSEFQTLIAKGFEVRRPQPLLNEQEFIAALDKGLVEIQIRWLYGAGDTLDYDLQEMFMKDVLLDPSRAYREFRDVLEYVPYIVGKLITEDEFVEIAAAQGTVDLSRVSRNPKTGEPFFDDKGRNTVKRYFGTKIGKSNGPAIEIHYGEEGVKQNPNLNA